MSRRFTRSTRRFAAGAVVMLLVSGFAAAQAPSLTAPAGPLSAPKPTLEDIRDIRGPSLISSPWTLAIICAAAALAATGGYGAWRWKRRRLPPALLPFEVALRRLDRARDLMAVGDGRLFSIEASDTVRTYLEIRFAVEAAHRTTQEFLHDQLNTTDVQLAAHTPVLKEFLLLCDLAKFGGWNLRAQDMEAMFQKARRFVLDTAVPIPIVASLPNAVVPTTASVKDNYVSLPST